MKIVNLGLAISLVIAPTLVMGCKKQPNSASSLTQGLVTNIIDTSNLLLVSDTEEKERNQFESDVIALALKGDFQSLESQAKEFRSKKSQFTNGFWKLRAFYIAFGNDEIVGNGKAFSDLIGQLEKWAMAQPDSITPRLALVYAYDSYAWVARGSGWASQVTKQGERLMEERMEKAFNWLHEAQNLEDEEKDPAFYAAALHACLGASVNRADYEKIFNEGIQNSPDYQALYEYKAYYLLPRWYGQKGEWETYARQISRRKDIPNSEEIFARIALYLRDIGYFYDEFSGDDKSWDELKSSFHALEKNHPDSLEIKSIFCLMSLNVCDYKEAREQVKLLDGKVDLSVWDSKTNFLNGIQWMSHDDATLEECRRQYKAQKQAN